MIPHLLTRKSIAIVVPVCNEIGNLPMLINEVEAALQQLPYNIQFIFVEDSSTDGTLEYLKEKASTHSNIFYISLTKSFGHQNALKAGLDRANTDAVIMMDGDLQHPPALLPELIKQWENGYDIVYTIRNDHSETGLLKQKTSEFFYGIINNLSDIELEAGTADFRLMDSKVVAIFRTFSEADIFLRGLVKWMGFKQIGIQYTSALRLTGKSKYSFKKMARLAVQGITSFSTKPLYIAAYLGFVFSLCSLLCIPYIIISYFWERPVSGWASTIVTISFFGGLQLMILGIIGIYLGKLFMQSKQRPHYIIKESNL
ncbi:MAG: glycosyltransferase family 2 protein [Flavobacterium sp.]|nr:glycosyltransferase family 2 protein [Flavobacterium sp.]